MNPFMNEFGSGRVNYPNHGRVDEVFWLICKQNGFSLHRICLSGSDFTDLFNIAIK